ncbi:MAG: YegP family protein [Clostridia bacterium]|nr:YegP family protein [Clostridia bacterium]
MAPADKSIRIDSDRSVKISSSTRLSVPEEIVPPPRASESAATEKKKTADKGSDATSEKIDAKKSKATGSTSAQSSVSASTAVGGGYFDIKKSKDDRYVFNLYARNHVIIATSQVYSSVSAAQNGIDSVRENAPNAPVEDQTKKDFTPLSYPKWEIYEDGGGQFRFRLNASNGNCICHSQGYTKKTSCKNGIESIRRFAPTAAVKKSYLKKNT